MARINVGMLKLCRLCVVIQALLWLLYVVVGNEGAVMLCDSCYAMDMLDERATAQSNRDRILLKNYGHGC